MTVHFVNLLDDLRRHSLRMAGLVEDVLQEACEAVARRDVRLARRVVERDDDVDREEVAVESEVIRLLALYQPVGSDLRLLCTVLKVNNDLERIADCAVNIAERAAHLPSSAAGSHESDIQRLGELVRRTVRQAVQAFAGQDDAVARKVLEQDDAIDALYGQFIRSVVARGGSQSEDMAGALDLLSVAKNLERIADHATNIAEDVIFLTTGKIVRHADRADD